MQLLSQWELSESHILAIDYSTGRRWSNSHADYSGFYQGAYSYVLQTMRGTPRNLQL